jgi:hypothetical protein
LTGSRCHRCGDIELTGSLANATSPVSFVLDLHITHELWGSSSDPSINRTLNEAADDKIRSYRADYNNRPSNAISFMPDIASTSGRLHSEFVCLLILQIHWETDRFQVFCSFRSSASAIYQWSVPLPLRAVLLTDHIHDCNILVKAAALRIVLNIDGAPITSKSHTHPSHSSWQTTDTHISLLFSSRFITE